MNKEEALPAVAKRHLEMPLFGGEFALYSRENGQWKLRGMLHDLLMDQAHSRIVFSNLIVPQGMGTGIHEMRLQAISEGEAVVLSFEFSNCSVEQFMMIPPNDQEAMIITLVQYGGMYRQIASAKASETIPTTETIAVKSQTFRSSSTGLQAEELSVSDKIIRDFTKAIREQAAAIATADRRRFMETILFRV